MGRRLSYETIRKNLHLRRELVEFFEGSALLKPEERRIGYGFNKLVDELLEERRAKIIAAHAATLQAQGAPS